MNKKLWISLFGFLATHLGLWSQCNGKADIGPAYVRIDVLESGKTVKTMNLAAVKGDVSLVWGNGFALKPGFLLGGGDGSLASGSIGAGWYIPLKMVCKHRWFENVCILPTVGMTFSNIQANIHHDINIPVPMLGDFEFDSRFSEKFRSVTPFINLDISYSYSDNLKISGIIQWGWARTRTTLRQKDLISQINDQFGNVLPPELLTQLTEAVEKEANGTFKSRSQGPSYGVQIDYLFNDHWSANIGAAYNITLSREKHGLRGAGAKVGVAYWF